MKRQTGFSTIAVLGVLVVALGGYVGWNMYQRAQVKAAKQLAHDDAQKAREKFKNLQSQWQDSLTLAANTPRIGLAGPIQRLQDVRQQAKDVQVPACFQQGKDHIVSGMNQALDGMLAFMRNDLDKFALDELTNVKMTAMQTHFAAYAETASACPAP